MSPELLGRGIAFVLFLRGPFKSPLRLVIEHLPCIRQARLCFLGVLGQPCEVRGQRPLSHGERGSGLRYPAPMTTDELLRLLTASPLCLLRKQGAQESKGRRGVSPAECVKHSRCLSGALGDHCAELGRGLEPPQSAIKDLGLACVSAVTLNTIFPPKVRRVDNKLQREGERGIGEHL